MKYKCKRCRQSFKKEHELNEHFDIHTPYWTRDKKVKLSGADQIRLILAKSFGWEESIKCSEKNKHFYDIKKFERLRQFQEDNKIEFIVCDSEVESFREVLA